MKTMFPQEQAVTTASPQNGLHRVTEQQLVVGRFLRCDLYNEPGEVILRRGQRVAQSHRAILFPRGLYFDPRQVQAVQANELVWHCESPFCSITRVIQPRLKELLLRNGKTADFSTEILALVDGLIAQIRRDPDAAIAAAFLPLHDMKAVRHPLQAAIITYLVMTQMNLAQAVIRSVMGGALTMNIAIADSEDQILAMGDMLPPDLKMTLDLHPYDSEEILKALGVEDDVWLTTVLHHHERINGKGKPEGLDDSRISQGGKIVGLAARFLERLGSQAHGEIVPPARAIKELEKSSGAEDLIALRALVDVLGYYPPGTMVKLANNDIALVIQRSKDKASPLVRPLITPNGPTRAAQLRDTSDPAFAIRELMPANLIERYAKSKKLMALWGYADL